MVSNGISILLIMDWICEIEKHAGTLGRPPIFTDAMTTLSFRLEASLKEDINLSTNRRFPFHANVQIPSFPSQLFYLRSEIDIDTFFCLVTFADVLFNA